MSVYEEIQARITADEAHDAKFPCDETLEGARAEIIGDFLEVAERWRLKSQEWDDKEHYVHFRAIVCQQVLDAIVAELYDDEEGSTA